MKLFFALFLIAIFSVRIFAEPVSVKTANQVGLSFLAKSVTPSGILKTKKLPADIALVYSANDLKTEQNIVSFYVFSAGDHGYVIVAGDDRVIPILGYADKGSFNPDSIPPNMQKWLEGYKTEIRYAVENNILASPEIQSEWQVLKSGGGIKPQAMALSVAPLILTKWDQSPHYNLLCPYDNNKADRTITGCVATAMAQVMKFWNYPAKGSGFHSYRHSSYGTLSANFGSTTYDWSNMPNQVISSSSSLQKNAVSTLMYHCGVSVEMDYNVSSEGGSSAMTICSGYSNCTASAEDALKTYFGYKNTLQGIHKSDYTNTNWTNLIKTELNAGRPVIYAGRGSEGGHCFICDGYDNNNYFHFNWGWSGYNDGYFALTSLSPGSGGAGGGSYEFTDAQRAIIGIEPANGVATQTFDLRLYSNLNMSSTNIWFKDAFDLDVNIANYGTASFSGELGVAVFDSEGNFVDFMDIKSNMTLNANYHYSNGLTFSNTGSAAFVPGTYYAALFYKTITQDWTVVSNGAYTNFKEFEIYYSSDIEVNSSFNITTNGGELIRGLSANVNVDVVNKATNTFYGKYRVNLANLDGNWAQNIEILNESNGLPYNNHYPGGNDFTGIISVEPGTYLLEIAYQKQGSTNWYYAGSTDYSNPVYVIVKSPEIQSDIYEDNNTQSLAYNLPVGFSGNNASSNSTGSTLHIGTDIDYYKIALAPGFNYAVTPRLHDNYNSGNGETYTVDVLFSYSTNGSTYSETYDDVITGSVVVNNGGTLYFKIAPYFPGSTGTYLFDLNINRSLMTDVETPEINDPVSLYPNPADEYVYIGIQSYKGKINQVVLCDINGKSLHVKADSNYEGKIRLPLTGISNGVYLLKIYSDKEIITKKLIVGR